VKSPAFLTNNRLGWKGLQGTNTLAYYEYVVNYDRKKFNNIGPWLMLAFVTFSFLKMTPVILEVMAFWWQFYITFFSVINVHSCSLS
jgi:hypothetical protein